MTHKLENNYTKEVLALLQKFKDLQQLSQPGDPENRLRAPKEFDVEGQWDLITELPQDWGNRLLASKKKKKRVFTRAQVKGAVTPQETEPDVCECPGVSCGGVGRQ